MKFFAAVVLALLHSTILFIITIIIINSHFTNFYFALLSSSDTFFFVVYHLTPHFKLVDLLLCSLEPMVSLCASMLRTQIMIKMLRMGCEVKLYTIVKPITSTKYIFSSFSFICHASIKHLFILQAAKILFVRCPYSSYVNLKCALCWLCLFITHTYLNSHVPRCFCLDFSLCRIPAFEAYSKPCHTSL